MKSTFTIALPLAIGAGLMSATPASAANFYGAKEIRTELRMLDRQIDRKKGLSYREQVRLERRIDNVQALQRRYARNGYSRNELRILNQKVSAIKASIRYKARDSNRRSVKSKNHRR